MSSSATIETKPRDGGWPRDKPARSGGRPRNETTRLAILAAAIDLIKKDAVQSITIEAIARSAGVSKATIYRWWDSKASLVIDAFLEHHVIHTPLRRDVHPAEALVCHWRSLAEQYSDWPGRIVAQILAEGQSDPAVLREFRERFHYGRRAVVSEVANLLVANGAAGGMPTELLMDMFYGPIYMRLLWAHAPLNQDFIEQFPIHFFKSIGIEIDSAGRPLNAADYVAAPPGQAKIRDAEPGL